jgi:tetratricopeptide (TPR) repeat protein
MGWPSWQRRLLRSGGRLAGLLGMLGLVAVSGPSTAASDESDPAARWLGVYAWVSMAERLAEGGHQPLALGGYLEAGRRLEELAEAHPDFEPEMVAYRREALAAAVAAIEEALTDDEHGTMMRFLDFVESLEAGEAQRYANDYERAHETLTMARSLLDELAAEKPESFREAVAGQYTRLDSSLTWLASQLDYKAASAIAARRPTVPGEAIDWGTTRFVKVTDLPVAGGAVAMEGALFPDGREAAGQGAAPASRDADAEGSPKGPRFRMSSRQGGGGGGGGGGGSER